MTPYAEIGFPKLGDAVHLSLSKSIGTARLDLESIIAYISASHNKEHATVTAFSNLYGTLQKFKSVLDDIHAFETFVQSLSGPKLSTPEDVRIEHLYDRVQPDANTPIRTYADQKTRLIILHENLGANNTKKKKEEQRAFVPMLGVWIEEYEKMFERIHGSITSKVEGFVVSRDYTEARELCLKAIEACKNRTVSQ